MNTQQLLDAVKSRYSLQSDYALAKFLGIKQPTVSQYRTKGNTLSDETALLVADKLEMDPGEVIAWMHAERAKSPAAKKALERLARLAHKSAAALFLGGFVLAGGVSSPSPTAFCGLEHSILCKICRRGRCRRKVDKSYHSPRVPLERPVFTSFHLPH